MNNCERSIYYVILLTKKSIKEYKKINNKKKIYLTTYEKIVEETNKEILNISNLDSLGLCTTLFYDFHF